MDSQNIVADEEESSNLHTYHGYYRSSRDKKLVKYNHQWLMQAATTNEQETLESVCIQKRGICSF